MKGGCLVKILKSKKLIYTEYKSGKIIIPIMNSMAGNMKKYAVLFSR
jgi:hypothetical protein